MEGPLPMLSILGASPGDPVRVVAVDPGDAALEDVLGVFGPTATNVPRGPVHAVLCPAEIDLDSLLLPGNARAGVGPRVPAPEASRSWHAARSALRFAGSADGTSVIWWERLGGMAAIADRLAPEDIAGIPDVTALDRLAAEPAGADLLGVLFAFCATGSVRKAATAVYRHHSTIAPRLSHAEEVLGFGLDTPDGRFRLHLALLLRRLRDSA